MRARVQRSGKVYYYYETSNSSRKEVSLGPDFVDAVRKWAELEGEAKSPNTKFITFSYVAKLYQTVIFPTKKSSTQKDNVKELKNLLRFFGDDDDEKNDNPSAPIDQITPLHIQQYMDWRIEESRNWYISKKRDVPALPGKVRANREIALFSHIFNFARRKGFTKESNPSAGIKKFREDGREIYIEDEIYQQVWDAADIPLRDALDLAYLTGQRPADVLKLDESDIKKGELWVKQDKRGKKLRITIEGEFAQLIERIQIRKQGYKVTSTALIVDENGKRLTQSTLRSKFDKARAVAEVKKEDFQFRDLRAKAGTDKTESTGDIRTAQRQLGHTNITTTERYIRQRKGDKVAPTR